MVENRKAKQFVLAYFKRFAQEVDLCIEREQGRDTIIAELQERFPELHTADVSDFVDRRLNELERRVCTQAIRRIVHGFFWCFISLIVIGVFTYYPPVARSDIVGWLVQRQWGYALLAAAISWGLICMASGIYLRIMLKRKDKHNSI
jgi:hypothetical protein